MRQREERKSDEDKKRGAESTKNGERENGKRKRMRTRQRHK